MRRTVLAHAKRIARDRRAYIRRTFTGDTRTTLLGALRAAERDFREEFERNPDDFLADLSSKEVTLKCVRRGSLEQFYQVLRGCMATVHCGCSGTSKILGTLHLNFTVSCEPRVRWASCPCLAVHAQNIIDEMGFVALHFNEATVSPSHISVEAGPLTPIELALVIGEYARMARRIERRVTAPARRAARAAEAVKTLDVRRGGQPGADLRKENSNASILSTAAVL